MYLYVGRVLRIWDFVLKLSNCMLMLNVGIVIICSIIILFYFCFSLFLVLSGCSLVVVYLGGGMLFSVLYMYVGSECSIRDYFCNSMYMYVVLRLS